MLKRMIYLGYLCIVVLLILELCYRQYWVDFYAMNLEALNPKLSSQIDTPNWLLVGDSFTADPNSYVNVLRDSFLKEQVVINSSIQGTCLAQHRLFARKRINSFEPTLFIYQIYLGNDLLEYRHPTSSRELSLIRRIYWWLADRVRVLSFLNTRLLNVRQAIYHDLPTHYDSKLDTLFEVKKYSARTKLHIKAEPDYLHQTLYLGPNRRNDVRSYLKDLALLLQQVPDSCQKFVLLLPASAQLGTPYNKRYAQLGADTTGVSWSATGYPFQKALLEIVESVNAELLDPLPYFYKHSQKDCFYHANDPHLSPYGQAVLGKWLVKQM